MELLGSLFMVSSGLIFKFFFLLSIIISIISIVSSNYLLKNISMNKNMILGYMFVNVILAMEAYSILHCNINLILRYTIVLVIWGIIVGDCIYLMKRLGLWTKNIKAFRKY